MLANFFNILSSIKILTNIIKIQFKYLFIQFTRMCAILNRIFTSTFFNFFILKIGNLAHHFRQCFNQLKIYNFRMALRVFSRIHIFSRHSPVYWITIKCAHCIFWGAIACLHFIFNFLHVFLNFLLFLLAVHNIATVLVIFSFPHHFHSFVRFIYALLGWQPITNASWDMSAACINFNWKYQQAITARAVQ